MESEKDAKGERGEKSDEEKLNTEWMRETVTGSIESL